ncbi:MAG: Unknown protein [uncultured Sulfurovum sp.]|uniref:Sulfatase N-terminal domain-containing protein n=1 Tax=uncultured Sulfurovum sp. TaxID=269237 RepID=A0A6S6S9J2_9BACT|nr:MAG: Unknown protein [uncultured Sulfurovum sp.]
MKYWIFLVFIVFFIFENIFIEDIYMRMNHLFNSKGIYISAYYIFVTFVGFLSIAFLFFIREKFYFFLAMTLLLLSYTITLVYKQINGTGFTLNDLAIVLNEADAFALDALITYGSSIKEALLILVFVLVFIFVLRNVIVKNKMFIGIKYVIVSFVVALLLAYSVFYKTTGGTQTRPNLIKVLNTSIYYALNKLYYGEREVLEEKALLASKYQNIILVVDESIGGKYLSINSYEKETTPYLKSIENHFINLGLASSGANCSATSNLILMSGIQLEALPDKENRTLKKATIFQYAKNSGYKTHYISGQGLGLKFQNHMSKYDLKYIDNFSQLKEPYHHKSMPEEDIILETQKVLANSEKNFIFIVKHGSHFEWEDSYPKEERFFLPTLEASDALSLEKREEALNSYLNSIRYNVDLFFKYFLKEINFFDREDTLIIYTADHGQSILEDGRTSTHCDSTNPPLSQGIVPLLLFTSKEDKVFRAVDFQINSYNHYQLFPTIQKLMGYEGIKAQTLFDKVTESPSQVFVSGDIFGRVSLQRNDIQFEN